MEHESNNLAHSPFERCKYPSVRKKEKGKKKKTYLSLDFSICTGFHDQGHHNFLKQQESYTVSTTTAGPLHTVQYMMECGTG